MKIIIDKKLYGYCPGLKKAIELAEKLSGQAQTSGSRIYSDVPLAHNAEIRAKMEKKGIHVVEHISEIKPEKDDFFLVSAHGASKQRQSELSSRGFNVVDGICAKVKSVQNIAIKDYEAGYDIIIFGKPDHAETIGINGSINNQAYIVKNLENVDQIRLSKKTSLISQTTHSAVEFDQLYDILKKNNPGLEIVQRKTSCPVVNNRITSVVEKVEQEKIDKVIVVGSPTSSNTKQLFNAVAKVAACKMVADSRSVHPKDLAGASKVLVASGTSAPPEVVERVIEKIASIK